MARPRIKRPTLAPSTPFNKIVEFAKHNECVDIPGIGRFEVVTIPRKVTYHNFSQRERVIPSYGKLKFTQSAQLKNLLTN